MVVSLKSREGRPDLVTLGHAAVANEITLEVPSALSFIDELIDILSDLLGRTPLTLREAKDFKQAIVEMAGNAMKWGHGLRPELCVEINYRVRPEAVIVRVRDHGPGFDYSPVNQIDAERDPERRRAPSVENEARARLKFGFGIMLASDLTDEFSYNEVGNEVTLVKRFSAAW